MLSSRGGKECLFLSFFLITVNDYEPCVDQNGDGDVDKLAGKKEVVVLALGVMREEGGNVIQLDFYEQISSLISFSHSSLSTPSDFGKYAVKLSPLLRSVGMTRSNF